MMAKYCQFTIDNLNYCNTNDRFSRDCFKKLDVHYTRTETPFVHLKRIQKAKQD